MEKYIKYFKFYLLGIIFRLLACVQLIAFRRVVFRAAVAQTGGARTGAFLRYNVTFFYCRRLVKSFESRNCTTWKNQTTAHVSRVFGRFIRCKLFFFVAAFRLLRFCTIATLAELQNEGIQVMLQIQTNYSKKLLQIQAMQTRGCLNFFLRKFGFK